MNPNTNEKELFTVVVHENQFVVRARRVHQLLNPKQPYLPWLQNILLRCVLAEGADYQYHQPAGSKPGPKENWMVFTLFAVEKICVSVEEKQGRELPPVFRYTNYVEQRLATTCISYLGNYLSSRLSWRERNGHKIYKLASVLKNIGAVPATEIQLRKKYGQHFTTAYGQPYISHQLAYQLHLQHWLNEHESMLVQEQPFAVPA